MLVAIPLLPVPHGRQACHAVILRRMVRLLVVALLALLCGCATWSPKVPLQAGALPPGQAITLVRPPEVKVYKLHAMHPAMALGMVGRLAALAHMESRAEEMRRLMLGQNLAAHEVLLDVLARELTRAGYKVRVHSVSWGEDKWGHPEPDLKQLTAAHPRVLVLAPDLVGFWSQGLNGNYQPAVRVRATLYGPDRRERLYDAYHATGLEPGSPDWIDVPSGGEGYADFSALLAQPSATAASLRHSLALVAWSVAGDLTRRQAVAHGGRGPRAAN